MVDKRPRRRRPGATQRINALENTIAHYGQSIAALTSMINFFVNSFANELQRTNERIARLESANERREGEL